MEKRRTLKGGAVVVVHHNDGLRKRCECARRAWLKCPHPWHFNFKWQGKHYRFPLSRYAGERPVSTKNDARAEANRLRSLIQDGKFPPAHPITAGSTLLSADALTFDQFAEKWRSEATRDVKPMQLRNDAAICKRLGSLTLSAGQRFGDQMIGAITEADIEYLFRAHLSTVAGSTHNHYLQTVAHLQRWGVRKGFLTRRWLSDETDLGRRRSGQRKRRLVPDVVDGRGKVTTEGEERRLLAKAGPWLQRLIIAALETCCRRGELLALQWRDVDLSGGSLYIRAEHAKSGKGRRIPITTRLRGVLDMVRHDPDGKDHKADAYVFGNAIGEQVLDPKTGWSRCLTAAKITDLHFHDLRHEGASRLLDRGVPAHHVKELLGHANIATTDIYLNVDFRQLQDSVRRAEGAEALHAVAHRQLQSVGRVRNARSVADGKSLVN